jgi:hypothetical protein
MPRFEAPDQLTLLRTAGFLSTECHSLAIKKLADEYSVVSLRNYHDLT